MSSFENEIDNNLQELNIYYKDLIQDKVLSSLKIKELKRKSFINFMKSIGKLGGQNKVPRLSNDDNINKKLLKFKIRFEKYCNSRLNWFNRYSNT